MDVRRQIETSFGRSLFAQPLFPPNPGSLRFELADDGDRIAQFVTALDHALTIARDVFAEEGAFVLCLRTCSVDPIQRTRPALLKALDELEIPVPLESASWTETLQSEQSAAENTSPSSSFLAFHASVGLLRNALWGALARELDIRPTLPSSVYLLNLKTRIALFPYDDRGMDAFGPNHEVMSRLYSKHYARLLAHDLPTM